MKPGTHVRVVRLPKYWGAADIRGYTGIVVGPVKSPDGNLIMHWKYVLIGDKTWKIPDACLEDASEAG